MISIVVVSHSRALADAAVALAGEMVDSDTRPLIKVAAGVDETTFGTDAAAVAAAITDVDSADGILLLLDLGSAVLSTELALEFLDPAVAAHVTITSAPMVEGLVAAVVTASTGADMATVVNEARQGLTAKQQHLGDGSSASSSDKVDVTLDADTRGVDLSVRNNHGLHARPAAKLVALARSFDAQVQLTNPVTGRGPVDARSLSLVATLDARQGDVLRAQASGREADAALAALLRLADEDFGDAAPPAATAARRTSAGDGAGLDVALGPARLVSTDVDLTDYQPGEPDAELIRSETALIRVRESLVAVRRRTHAESGSDEAAIFDAHLALLDDAEVVDPVAAAIGSGTSAPNAWSDELGGLAGKFDALADNYQRARAQDVRSVQRRLLLALTGREDDVFEHRPGEPVVIVVPEVDAATAAVIDPAEVAGIVTIGGGVTGHGVIVAKSRGLAIYTDAGAIGAAVRDGDLIAFDAAARRFVVNPGPDETEEFEALIVERRRQRDEALGAAAEPAVTHDGTSINILANVASVEEARAAVARGADGSGLVRTEVLFGGWRAAPTADEQLEGFLALSEALGGRPMTVRTWDVGGDKPLAFLPLAVEANPFLGRRGLRAFRGRPELLVEQLKAVCRLATKCPTRVMFPMVTTRAEVDWALERLHEASAVVGGALPDSLEVGVMVEVPAAALRVADLARGLDFVSIGTNDLTQYTVAAERGNAAVSELADAFDPAVLRLVRTVCEEVSDSTTVAVCGDLASDVEGAALLLGLGVRELSVVGPAAALVKQRVRRLDLVEAAQVATDAVAASSADAVRTLVRTAFEKQN